MIRSRVTETNAGIQNEVTAADYNDFARDMRDRGWNGVSTMIDSGIRSGRILEIGSGSGYVGLELMKQMESASLTGCEISPAMIRIARKNASQYGISAEYV